MRVAVSGLVVALGLTVGLSDVSAQTVRYVRADAPVGGNGSSWAMALRRVHDAVIMSQPGDSVWVAAGTYRPLGAGNSIDLRPGVAIYGGFNGTETSLNQRDWRTNVTILSGDVLGDDDIGGTTNENSLIVSVGGNILANAVLDGFTLRSGAGNPGGAIRCQGSPSIRNCTFTRNVGFNGAAVSVPNGPAVSPRFSNCTFVRNGTLFSNTTTIFQLESISSEVRLVGCQFIANNVNGGGVINGRMGHLIMVNCSVIGNTLRGSSGAVFIGSGSVPSLTMINCTVAGNTNTESGPAGLNVNVVGLSILIRNSIFWGNVGPGLPLERAQLSMPSNTYRADYCRVQGWTGTVAMGTATSAMDPMLMDLDGPDDLPATGDEDVRLRAGSSAIDAANNFYVWPDINDIDNDGNVSEPTPLDLAGAARFLDDPATTDTGAGTAPILDIGAFEYPGLVQACRADFNDDGFVNSQDFFEFLNVFFAGCP